MINGNLFLKIEEGNFLKENITKETEKYVHACDT